MELFEVAFKKTNEKEMKPSLIVSFTSYPARIHAVPQVLESLYAQSMKADRILLWLAEEQFPNKEADLPKSLIDDAAAGKFELRWCDDLGSHKKYFYTMQEFPDDIVVTVDDDCIYHPDLLKVLYESYLRYPYAVSAFDTFLILLNDKGRPQLFSHADYFFRQLREPSMQLWALGAGGILYPPYSLDSRVFNKETILKNLKAGDTCCSDDIWLKMHEVLANTPVVLASDGIMKKTIQFAQESSLNKNRRKEKYSERHLAAIHNHYIKDGRDELFECFRSAIKSTSFIADDRRLRYDYAVKRVEQKIAATSLGVWGSDEKEQLPDCIRYTLSEINRQMSRETEEGTEREWVAKLRELALSVEGVEEMAEKDFSLKALIDYEVVLRRSMWGVFRTPADYIQMQSNWEAFLKKHPVCDSSYRKNYEHFLKDMKGAIAEMEQNGATVEELDECRKVLDYGWRGFPLRIRARKWRWNFSKLHSKRQTKKK